MIAPADVAPYIRQQIPELSGDLPEASNVYSTMKLVRDHACQLARAGNIAGLKQCFSLAESLYERGSGAVKCAVENVFVFSLSRLFMAAPESREQVKAILPGSLRSLYMAQVMDHGY